MIPSGAPAATAASRTTLAAAIVDFLARGCGLMIIPFLVLSEIRVLKIAVEENIPVIALGGCVEAVEQLNEMGFTAVLSVQPAPVSLDQAMQQEFALKNIERTVTQLIRIIKCFKS